MKLSIFLHSFDEIRIGFLRLYLFSGFRDVEEEVFLDRLKVSIRLLFLAGSFCLFRIGNSLLNGCCHLLTCCFSLLNHKLLVCFIYFLVIIHALWLYKVNNFLILFNYLLHLCFIKIIVYNLSFKLNDKVFQRSQHIQALIVYRLMKSWAGTLAACQTNQLKWF